MTFNSRLLIIGALKGPKEGGCERSSREFNSWPWLVAPCRESPGLEL
jgi:hypothetical protein